MSIDIVPDLEEAVRAAAEKRLMSVQDFVAAALADKASRVLSDSSQSTEGKKPAIQTSLNSFARGSYFLLPSPL